MREDWWSDEDIRGAKLANLRARLSDCTALARDLELDDVEVAILRAEAILTPAAEEG